MEILCAYPVIMPKKLRQRDPALSRVAVGGAQQLAN
jgi:hypothetical protein